jgi:hypothetical protein
MNRYFQLKNQETLEVYVSLPLDKQPENSVPFFETNFHKTVFDKYPNPTTVTEGGEPLPIEIPQIITRRQFKIALAVLGKNETDILNGINQLPEPTQTIARISYTEAGTFERFNPELIFVANNFLQMTESDIDEIFTIGNQY